MDIVLKKKPLHAVIGATAAAKLNHKITEGLAKAGLDNHTKRTCRGKINVDGALHITVKAAHKLITEMCVPNDSWQYAETT